MVLLISYQNKSFKNCLVVMRFTDEKNGPWFEVRRGRKRFFSNGVLIDPRFFLAFPTCKCICLAMVWTLRKAVIHFIQKVKFP